MPVLPLPKPTGQRQDQSAPQFLIEACAADPGITLVAVAPLSNIATAIALDSSFVEYVFELMIMGGGITRSNMTASAEFNIWADP